MEENNLKYKTLGQGRRQNRAREGPERGKRSEVGPVGSVSQQRLPPLPWPCAGPYTLWASFTGDRVGRAKDLGSPLLPSTPGPACSTVYFSPSSELALCTTNLPTLIK